MNIKLDKQRWDSFWSYWEKELPGQIKDAKRQAMQAAGEAIRDEVNGYALPKIFGNL